MNQHLIETRDPTTDADRQTVIEAVKQRRGGISDRTALILWRRMPAADRRRYLGLDPEPKRPVPKRKRRGQGRAKTSKPDAGTPVDVAAEPDTPQPKEAS